MSSKVRKIYFYDNKIRNAVIKQFNPIELKADQEHCGKILSFHKE